MDTYITKDRNNFWQLNWLDKFLVGHKGFIAGGCFKNIFENKKVKDIDIFFESEEDWADAVLYFDKRTPNYFDIFEPEEEDIFDGTTDVEPEYMFKYENHKVKAYTHIKSGIQIELCRATFGKPKDVLNNFDFTITKFAYYKEEVPDEPIDESYSFDALEAVHIEYKTMFHKDFFEHLQLKRLVVDDRIPFPMSTFERTIRYIGYGYRPCKETKLKIALAINEMVPEQIETNESLYDGWD